MALYVVVHDYDGQRVCSPKVGDTGFEQGLSIVRGNGRVLVRSSASCKVRPKLSDGREIEVRKPTETVSAQSVLLWFDP